MWDEVCEGESEYINPYRDSADFKLDTTLDYEPNIFHSYLLPFLENVPASLPNTTASWMNCTSVWMSFLTSTTPRRFRRTVSFGNLSVRVGKASRQNKKRI